MADRGAGEELTADGIRVCALMPGLMNTESNKADLPEFYKNKIVGELQLTAREGRPEDLVGAMLFFCSEQASFITGETC